MHSRAPQDIDNNPPVPQPVLNQIWWETTPGIQRETLDWKGAAKRSVSST